MGEQKKPIIKPWIDNYFTQNSNIVYQMFEPFENLNPIVVEDVYAFHPKIRKEIEHD